MRVALLFPPQWIPLNPHFALVKLAGHLRALGVSVELHDLNVRFYREILSSRYLAFARHRARKAHQFLVPRVFAASRRGDRSREAALDAARLLALEAGLEQGDVWDQVQTRIDDAVSVFDDRDRFYDPAQLVRAYLTVDKALELASLPAYPFRVRFNDYSTPGCRLTFEEVLAATVDSDRNMFLFFYRAQLARVLRPEPQVVGVSINSHSQVIPGLTLARMLKERLHGQAHVTLGGNYFIRVKKALLRRPEMLEVFADSVILGEGEKPLERLLEAIGSRGSLSQVPGVVHLGTNGRPALTTPATPFSLEEDALPSLEGIDLKSYFTPDPVVSVRTSKGCYWQKCTFCDTDYGICPDIKSVNKLLDEMEYLKTNHGIENFCFIDECIRPRYMETISRGMVERGLDVHWYGNGRIERSFTPQRLEKLVGAGLTMLMWGLESGSERIMGLINKGIPLERRLEVLADASRAGVWNFAYVFFGFPSETDEEAMQTIRMLCDERDIIHSYGRSVFTLGKHAILREKAMDLGVVEMMVDDEELSTSLHYTTTAGREHERALERSELCKAMCALAHGDPLWMYLRYREVIHLYLKERGRDFVRQFRFDPQQRAEFQSLFSSSDTGSAIQLGIDNP